MKTTVKLTGAVAVLALALSGCGSKGQEFSHKTLKFTERDTNDFGFADNAPKAKVSQQGPDPLSRGDMITFAPDLLDAAKKKVGSVDVSCVITQGGHFEQTNSVCSAVATVPGGTLVVQLGGKVFAGATTRGAVVGGTGEFKGATGEFTSVGDNDSKDTIDILVPKQ